MKEIQVAIRLDALRDLNEKLTLRRELAFYIEVYFASVRARSKLIRKYPQDKSPVLSINQTLNLKHNVGTHIEFWLRSEQNDSILGAFSLPCQEMTINSLELIEDTRVFSLSGVDFATLCFSYQ